MQIAIDELRETGRGAITTDRPEGSGGVGGATVELVPVGRLKPYAGNARKHSRKQIRQIADSIKSFGFTNPVLIDDDHMIIAGQGRLEAAKLLKLAAVPTLRLSHLSAAQKRAYIIADNKLAENAGWDRDMLAIELQGLIELDVDIELTGFEMGEIDIILDEARQSKRKGEDHEDDIPNPASGQGATVSRIGDLWTLGANRLLCGDARDDKSYKLVLGGAKAELVFADPHYNVAISGHVCGRGEVQHREFAMASGEMTPTDFTEFLKSTFERLVAHATDGSVHYVCMDWRHIGEMMAAGSAVYTELKNLVVWAKTNFGMGGFYRSQHELIFVWKSGRARHINNFELGQYGRSRSNVWRYDGISTMRPGRQAQLKLHPTCKPAALVADALEDCSRRGGFVLDPFAGSGTIFIAAEQTGRQARGIEIDPAYVDVAIRRWQRFTGKSAILAGTSETFAELEEQRTNPEASNIATIDDPPAYAEREAA